MNSIWELIQRGGPVMYAIIALSVILYSRCFLLLMLLRESRKRLQIDIDLPSEGLAELRRYQGEVQESFRHHRHSLGTMIAAAPLLGLLGTVSGMVTTFESLSSNAGQKSMEGLAGGISEVLVATESGLSVAIPAMLIVTLAHREMHKHLQKLNQLEHRVHSSQTP